MFKMIIELDEERMARDGLDVEAAWKQIDEMLVETGKLAETEEIFMEEKGIIHIGDLGTLMFLEELFEETAWFMKYVCKYLINYINDEWEDVIEAYREEGVKICYE